MSKDPWTASIKLVDGEVVVDQIISFDDDFPDGTWVLDDCIWATEQEAHYVAQKRIKTRFNQRKKTAIFQIGKLDRMYSVQEFMDLMAQ